MREGYCPQCFARIPLEARTCPACGENIAALSERDFSEKLMHALSHPLADIRMRAILALGLRADEQAAGALVACALRHPTDIVEGIAVVESVSRVRDAQTRRRALEALVERHPAQSVRKAARRAVDVHRAGNKNDV